jgi:uncharacterized glyoxalase superfamily protein PhnB
MFLGTISMLRVAGAKASQKMYCEQLGFATSWIDDVGDGSPVFVEVTRDAVAFHLSEHVGDGPLAVQLYVNVADAFALYAEFCERGVDIAALPEQAPWGHTVFEVVDLDGNTLRFGSPTP